MPASDRLGDDEILRRMECAWSEQCGSCLNFINAEMPLILGEREALKRELLQREDSERLRMLRLIARFKRLVHEKQEALAERDAEVARLVASWQRAGDLLPYTLHRSECFQYVKGPGYCSCGLLDVIRDYGRAALAARGDGNG